MNQLKWNDVKETPTRLSWSCNITSIWKKFNLLLLSHLAISYFATSTPHFPTKNILFHSLCPENDTGKAWFLRNVYLPCPADVVRRFEAPLSLRSRVLLAVDRWGIHLRCSMNHDPTTVRTHIYATTSPMPVSQKVRRAAISSGGCDVELTVSVQRRSFFFLFARAACFVKSFVRSSLNASHGDRGDEDHSCENKYYRPTSGLAGCDCEPPSDRQVEKKIRPFFLLIFISYIYIYKIRNLAGRVFLHSTQHLSQK